DAGLQLRRVKDELGSSAFLRYRVVAGDGELSEGLAIRGDPVPERGVVDCVGQSCQGENGNGSTEDHALQPMVDFSTQHWGHRRVIITAARRHSERRGVARGSRQRNRRIAGALRHKSEQYLT